MPNLDLARQAQSESERLEPELEKRAAAALAQVGLVENFYSINGLTFRLRFAGQNLARQMSRALQHLAARATQKISLTINCWDSATTGVPYPPPHWPRPYWADRGELRELDGPHMRIAYFGWLNLFNAYFPKSRTAYYCLGNAQPFPIQQMGSPALTIFSWWFATLGWQFTHAAAVGTEQGGVLIAGYGGAGKSTLAFSTLGTSLRYLSDDYCVLVPGDPPRAIALYNSGKLTERSLQLLPHLRVSTANANHAQREKAVFFLAENFPRQQLLSAPLRAIVLSELDPLETSLHPVEPGSVRHIIARSTLSQLAGSSPRDLMQLIQLLVSLPTFRLRHGSDASAAHLLLLRLCES